MKHLFAMIAIVGTMALPAFAQETPSNPVARVYFANLQGGATVTSPVTIVFGLSGMVVAPAGTEKENTRHHHLLIDRTPLAQGEDGADELMYGILAD